MSYETSMQTEIKTFPIMTVFVGKEIVSNDAIEEKLARKSLKTPQIQNKKEIVHKLIKYFKNS